MTEPNPIAQSLSDADEHSCQMQDGVDYQALAEAVLAPLAAKARALREQLDAKLRADVLREAADAIAPEQFGYGGPDHDDAWTAAQQKLRRMADAMQPPAPVDRCTCRAATHQQMHTTPVSGCPWCTTEAARSQP